MRKVTIDKEAMTATAQGGCLAQDIEFPAEAEGLSVVFGVLNETGKHRLASFPFQECSRRKVSVA